MFNKFILNFQFNLFEHLLKSTEFENIINGRKGANLVDYKNGLIPLVRTTTVYHKPYQKFLDIHYNIIDNIKKTCYHDNFKFNNALIEVYDSNYTKMGYHSDQSMDLQQKSYICIFSCYNNPTTKNLRTLRIKNKLTNESFDILIEHNSIILFSLDINSKYLHKIILESKVSDDLWLGMTLRYSKTIIQHIDNKVYFNSTLRSEY